MNVKKGFRECQQIGDTQTSLEKFNLKNVEFKWNIKCISLKQMS